MSVSLVIGAVVGMAFGWFTGDYLHAWARGTGTDAIASRFVLSFLAFIAYYVLLFKDIL